MSTFEHWAEFTVVQSGVSGPFFNESTKEVGEMRKRPKRSLVAIAVVLLAWAAVPATAHERDAVAVRDGVVAAAGYAWADADGTDFGSMWFEVGELPSPKKRGKKGGTGSTGVLVSITAVAPQECDLDAEPAIGRTRVMHGSLVIDGSNGTAVFDGDRLVEVSAAILCP